MKYSWIKKGKIVDSMDDKKKIILIEVAVALLFILMAFSPRMYPDEGTYLNYGDAWSEGVLIPEGEIPVPNRPVFISIASVVSGFSLPIARMDILPFVLGSVFLGFKIGKEIGLPGEFTSLPLLFSPIYLTYFGTFLTDYVLVFFTLLSIYFFFRSRDEDSSKYGCLMGVSTALAILTRESAVLLIVIFLVFYKEFRFKEFLVSAFVPVLGYMAFLRRDFFLFLEYSLEYGYEFAVPGIQSFLNMVLVGLGPVLLIAILGLVDREYGELPVKLSLVYLLVMGVATLVFTVTWVPRYMIMLLPGLLIPSAKGLLRIEKNVLLSFVLILVLGAGGSVVAYRVNAAERDWGIDKYEQGVEVIDQYEDGEVYMQINDEQLRWLKDSDRFRKLPRTYQGLKKETGCEDVPVFLWKYRGYTIWKPGYWDDVVIESVLEDVEEGKMVRISCLDS